MRVCLFGLVALLSLASCVSQTPGDLTREAGEQRFSGISLSNFTAAASDPAALPLQEGAEATTAAGSDAPKDAAEEPSAPRQKPEKGAPLPLQTIEGVGGLGLTEQAYLLNPSVGDEWLGLPTVSATHVQTKYKNGEILAVSETLFKRLELSYSFNDFGLGDFDLAVKNKLGATLSSDWVQMHTFSGRVLLLKEGEFAQNWLPAVTAGVHCKYNATINQFDNDLGGALHKVVGVKDNQGVDYTLTATKFFKNVLPLPLFVSGTVRETDAAEIGLLGFTDRYETVFEGNAGVFLAENVLLAGEYRQMPNDLKQIPGVLGPESDWWSIAASYILNKHTNVSVAYSNLGTLLNHKEPVVLGVQFKYEF